MQLRVIIIVAGALAAATAVDANAQSKSPAANPNLPSHLQSNPTGPKTDNLGDMSEEQQLRLQMEMDRRSKLLEAESNMLKKSSKTQEGVIQNMK